MNAMDRMSAEMINVTVDICKARIEKARTKLHSIARPTDTTDKVAMYSYYAIQKSSMQIIENDTRTLNKLLDR